MISLLLLQPYAQTHPQTRIDTLASGLRRSKRRLQLKILRLSLKILILHQKVLPKPAPPQVQKAKNMCISLMTLQPPAEAAAPPSQSKTTRAGLRNPLRRVIKMSILPALRAHFGHPESLGLLGEAAGHLMIQMAVGAVVVEVAAAVAVAAVVVAAALGRLSATPTGSASLLPAIK